MRHRIPSLALCFLIAATAILPAQGTVPLGGAETGFWDGLTTGLGLSRSDPDLGFVVPTEPRLEILVVRPDPRRPGLRYAVDCSHTKPSQREAFRTIPWLAPVDCLDDGELREIRAELAGGGKVRPFAAAMHGELRRAMAFGTAPIVEAGNRLSLAETARRILALTDKDRTWPAKSPRWMLREGAPGQRGAMERVDGGLVAGLFDSWLFRMKDWRVEGSPMDPEVAALWKARQQRWLDQVSGKTRGDWDLGRTAWLALFHAAVRNPAVAALELPRDPFEDAFLVSDHAKWGEAYKDFGRVPVQQVWPAPQRP